MIPRPQDQRAAARSFALRGRLESAARRAAPRQQTHAAPWADSRSHGQLEVGLRLAAGALQVQIVLQSLGQGMRVWLLGCMAGLALAAAFTKLLARILFGVSPWDVITIAGVARLRAQADPGDCFRRPRYATACGPPANREALTVSNRSLEIVS